jgi:prepilin-type N-terminal cleavage/methylation domain-containing protein
MKKNNLIKGFTLIELLVVIAIIGILGAIVYAPFQTARRKGRDAQKIVEIKNLQASLLLYADSNGGYYPDNLTELQNAMSDKLPSKANFTGTWDPNKYNYVVYKQTISGITHNVGFHLITHLETASPVLSGTAGCRGITAGAGLTPCLVGNGVQTPTSDSNGAIAEPDVSTAKLLSSERTTETDSACATDSTSCIFDLKS